MGSLCTKSKSAIPLLTLTPSSKPKQSTFNDVNKNFKIVLAGESCSGKSSLIERMVCNQFNENIKNTVGIDFVTKTVLKDFSIVKRLTF
jgi:GTPase SAR1 family protein